MFGPAEFAFYIFCFLFLSSFLFILWLNRKNLSTERILGSAGGGLLISGMVLCIMTLSTQQTECNNPKATLLTVTMENCVVVSPAGKILRVFIDRQRIWKRNKLFDKGNIRISLEKAYRSFATDSFSPITANPKVRDLDYLFGITIPEGLLAKLQVLRFEKKCGRSIDREFEYWITEFMETNSISISAFYNRLNKQQQREFFRMAKKFIYPKIKDSGAKFTKAKFDLPSKA